jgi:PIN domain nuclease of toxin-antitoxin system
VFVSAVSIWEIAIKLALGKLDLRDTPMDRVVAAITASGFNELPITALHAAEVAALPRHHSDPFDRLLVAQARFNDLTLVTEDHWIERYDVQTIGAA